MKKNKKKAYKVNNKIPLSKKITKIKNKVQVNNHSLLKRKIKYHLKRKSKKKIFPKLKQKIRQSNSKNQKNL